jgi:hypothetical protein
MFTDYIICMTILMIAIGIQGILLGISIDKELKDSTRRLLTALAFALVVPILVISAVWISKMSQAEGFEEFINQEAPTLLQENN